MKVYVNGQMMTAGDITMPVNKDPMDKCFVGGSHLNNDLHMFKGQMAAIYLISEPVSQSVVVALYRLGPGYKVCSKYFHLLLAFYKKVWFYNLPEKGRKKQIKISYFKFLSEAWSVKEKISLVA